MSQQENLLAQSLIIASKINMPRIDLIVLHLYILIAYTLYQTSFKCCGQFKQKHHNNQLIYLIFAEKPLIGAIMY